MKIITWNVNGIRAVSKKGFKDFVETEAPDILCLQETKAFEEQFLKEVGELEGYKYIWHAGERAGYAGTVIFYKEALEVIGTKNNFGEIEHFTADGRMTELEFYYLHPPTGTSPLQEEDKHIAEHIVLLNGYFPNGGTRADGTEMVSYKLDFYTHLKEYTRKLKADGKQVIITGDFNIVHTEVDMARPKQNQNSIGFLPVEREKIGDFIADGNIDVFRHFYPDQIDTYSRWSYRAGARARNVGWRIDYFVVNQEFSENLENIIYRNDVLGSDHCPVELVLK